MEEQNDKGNKDKEEEEDNDNGDNEEEEDDNNNNKDKEKEEEDNDNDDNKEEEDDNNNIFLDLSTKFVGFVLKKKFGFVDNFFWICQQFFFRISRRDFLDLLIIFYWIC